MCAPQFTNLWMKKQTSQQLCIIYMIPTPTSSKENLDHITIVTEGRVGISNMWAQSWKRSKRGFWSGFASNNQKGIIIYICSKNSKFGIFKRNLEMFLEHFLIFILSADRYKIIEIFD